MSGREFVQIPPHVRKMYGWVGAALFQKLCFWSNREGPDISRTQDELEENPGLTKRELETARGRLVKAGVLKFHRAGNTTIYTLDHDLHAKLEAKFFAKDSAKRPIGLNKTCNRIEQNVQSVSSKTPSGKSSKTPVILEDFEREISETSSENLAQELIKERKDSDRKDSPPVASLPEENLAAAAAQIQISDSEQRQLQIQAPLDSDPTSSVVNKYNLYKGAVDVCEPVQEDLFSAPPEIQPPPKPAKPVKPPTRHQVVFGWLSDFVKLDSKARVGKVAKYLVEMEITNDQMAKCSEYWGRKKWFKAGNRPQPEAVGAEWPAFLEWYEANKSQEIFNASCFVIPVGMTEQEYMKTEEYKKLCQEYQALIRAANQKPKGLNLMVKEEEEE